MRQALSDSDFETIRLTGHNLYGSGSAYGLDEISWLGENIERAADAKDGGQIQSLIDQMTDYLQRLRVF